MSKEDEDKIIELIDQGYKDAEISRKIGKHRTTIANRRKEYLKRKQSQEKSEKDPEETIQREPFPEPQKYTQAHTDDLALSKSAKSRLRQLHTLLGFNSMEAMIESVYADQFAADKYRSEYVEFMGEGSGFEAPKTFAEIIEREQNYSADLNYDLEMFKKGYSEYNKTIAELKEEHQEIYDDGYGNGKKDHAIIVPCVGCGIPITIMPGHESHSLIIYLLRESNIAHNDCIPRFKRIYVK